MSLEGRIALITGASRGIGAGIMDEMLARGATVVGTATSEQGASGISDRIAAAGGQGSGQVVDVADGQAVTELLKTVGELHGAPQILINNAGITRDQLLLRMSDDDWEAIMTTNLQSVFRLTKACVRGMMKARWGRIINVASVVGVTGNAGQANYAAAKAGIIGFTKSVAKEIGSRGITANVIAPGFIDTDMTRSLDDGQRQALLSQVPLGRLGAVEDIAKAVGFLASDDAGYLTGETLHVNGGMYMP
jgi:3-oxoacyl-[acyl-carrier protein] reductase